MLQSMFSIQREAMKSLRCNVTPKGSYHFYFTYVIIIFLLCKLWIYKFFFAMIFAELFYACIYLGIKTPSCVCDFHCVEFI